MFLPTGPARICLESFQIKMRLSEQVFDPAGVLQNPKPQTPENTNKYEKLTPPKKHNPRLAPENPKRMLTQNCHFFRHFFGFSTRGCICFGIFVFFHIFGMLGVFGLCSRPADLGGLRLYRNCSFQVSLLQQCC